MIKIFSPEFLVRPPTINDLEDVQALLEVCDKAEYGVPDITLGDLRTLWQGPNFHMSTDAWMVIAPGDRLIGYADVEHREHVRVYTFVRVLPEYAGQGVEEYLLQLAEEWALRQIALAKTAVRVTLNSWTSNLNDDAQRSFERAGFKQVRRHWRMEIAMSASPLAPVWPERVVVRTFIPGQDDRIVFHAVDEAFQDHWGHMKGNFDEWKHWTIERENFDPSLWSLAFEGEEIAGASLCTYQIDDGWVDTLAVRRPWRRKGLGMALLLHSFGEFYRRGKYKVGLGVDSQNLTGATRLYERAGMHVARIYNSYEKELRAGIELSTQVIPI
jgi:GNAT superfamily N-acetyltransferase